MPPRLKKKRKIDRTDSAEVRAIHIAYFSTIGQTYGRVSPYGGPAWRADFIKWGRPDYRRRAWEAVREEVREKLPPEVFAELDSYFTDGPALSFVHGFSYEDRERLQAAVEQWQKGDNHGSKD